MNHLEAQVARRNITPPGPLRLFGYPVERIGRETADPLSATVLVLRQGPLTVALVVLDWCLVDEVEVAAIRAAIGEASSLAPQHVIVSATHTHSAPATIDCWGWGSKEAGYLEFARARVVEAVVEALGKLKPVKIGVGTVRTDIGINRREVSLAGEVMLGSNPYGPYDDEMTVVRFEGQRGTVAQLVHAGAHPTARGHHPAVSRDWPGVMLDRIEKITGAPTLFLNGAFGDIAPRCSVRGSVGDGPIAAEEVGLRAAFHALECWRSIKSFETGRLHGLSENFELPLAPLPSLEEAEREFAKQRGSEDAKGEAGCNYQHWRAVVEALQQEPRESRSWEQTIIQLGPVALVPFAGEIFSEIALRLKRASPFQHTLCLGTTNGSHGYYVTREARARGGYEVWVARAYGARLLAANIDDFLVQENARLLQRLRNEAA